MATFYITLYYLHSLWDTAKSFFSIFVSAACPCPQIYCNRLLYLSWENNFTVIIVTAPQSYGEGQLKNSALCNMWPTLIVHRLH